MWTVMPSPVGDLRIVERDGSIVAIEFSPFRQPADGRPLGPRSDDHPVLAEAVRQLTAYFARELTDFDLPLAPVGTDFQRRVWTQLGLIGYGETASYGEIAHRLGKSNAASRAVGLAAALADGRVLLDRGPDRDDVRRALLDLPGIGPWTADYVAMRALGHPDVFLPTDLAVRRLLADLATSGAGEPDPERWRPWRSYALMHLWNTLMPDTPAPSRADEEN